MSFFWVYWYIYLRCTSVKLKGPNHSWELCQKYFYNLEYLDQLKMHFLDWPNVFLQTLF